MNPTQAAPALLAVAVWLAPGAVAQIPVGADAPALEIQEAFNDGPTAWQELRGKAILVKFTATW